MTREQAYDANFDMCKRACTEVETYTKAFRKGLVTPRELAQTIDYIMVTMVTKLVEADE